MAGWVFWLSLGFVAYTYFGYPMILMIWNRLAPRAVLKAPNEPDVTLIMVACNEKENIRQKILNCLSLDYPRERLQLIVSLDGPTDGTELLALSFAGRGVQVTYVSQHKGKAAAINNAVAKARGSILVFVDTRQRLDRGVIRELTANFSDPSVGAVSGELMLDSAAEDGSDGAGVYWKYEKYIRFMESRVHSVVGVSGALYAVRRSFFQELPVGTILDDVVVPMRIVIRGSRVVLDKDARAFDHAAQPGREFRRKVRTLAGNFQLLVRMPELLNPFRNPLFFQFVSHKVARLFVPYALVALFVANLFLRTGGYLVFLWLQSLWYGLALAGLFFAYGWRPVSAAAKHKVEGRV